MPIVRKIALSVALAVALAGGATTAPTADAAPYVPGEQLAYDTGENPRDIGDWPSGVIWVDDQFVEKPKLWNVRKAVAAARKSTGLDIRLSGPRQDLSKARNVISISSDRSGYTGPTGKRLGDVGVWSTKKPGGTWLLDAADISLDDKDGKKASKKKRDRKLASYIRQAAGR